MDDHKQRSRTLMCSKVVGVYGAVYDRIHSYMYLHTVASSGGYRQSAACSRRIRSGAGLNQETAMGRAPQKYTNGIHPSELKNS